LGRKRKGGGVVRLDSCRPVIGGGQKKMQETGREEELGSPRLVQLKRGKKGKARGRPLGNVRGVAKKEIGGNQKTHKRGRKKTFQRHLLLKFCQ